MIKGISNTAETARGLAGTMKARAELNSAAFSEMLGAADGKARQNKAHSLSRITAQTVQNMTALFASAPKAAATQTAKAGSLSFEQRATLEESAELLQHGQTICGWRCNCTIRARRSVRRRCSNCDG